MQISTSSKPDTAGDETSRPPTATISSHTCTSLKLACPPPATPAVTPRRRRRRRRTGRAARRGWWRAGWRAGCGSGESKTRGGPGNASSRRPALLRARGGRGAGGTRRLRDPGHALAAVLVDYARQAQPAQDELLPAAGGSEGSGWPCGPSGVGRQCTRCGRFGRSCERGKWEYGRMVGGIVTSAVRTLRGV